MFNPLGNAFKSTDNGGVIPAIDAYKDGIGVIVLDNLNAGIHIDNSSMNTLVYKYGEAAKANNTTITDEVLYGSGTVADKKIAGKLTVNGATCSDGNIATTGETWLNGVCQGGVSSNGTNCDDNNVLTYNDIYTNGVCAGVTNGTSCNDSNSETYNDIYTNGVCTGVTNGTTCNDNNPATTGETWLNGLCQGGTSQTFVLTNTILNNNIDLTGNKGGISFISLSNNPYGYINFNGLFNNIRTNEYNTENVSYWFPKRITELRVNIIDTVRIWRSGTTTWAAKHCQFGIKKQDSSGIFIDMTNELSLQTSSITQLNWEVFTNELTPGEYIFYTTDTNCPNGRIDSEWFVEKKI